MVILGITGGIGSGKSRVLEHLSTFPETVILEADRLAHELMLPGTGLSERILDTFGDAVRNASGGIDRNALGAVVFSDPEKLDTLNRLVHPAVKDAIRERIREEREKGTKLFVLEAALLIQDGYKEICDEIWYIYADREIRLDRLVEYRGGDREKYQHVMENQPEDAYFEENCDRVLDNSHDFSLTRQKIDEEIPRLLLKFDIKSGIIL